jgi:hypothetical protein
MDVVVGSALVVDMMSRRYTAGCAAELTLARLMSGRHFNRLAQHGEPFAFGVAFRIQRVEHVVSSAQ